MNKQQRIVNIKGEIDEGPVMVAIFELLSLDSEDSTQPIYLYINSPGGSIDYGLALMDAMKHINSPVYTVCYGLAASMGSFILSCGEKGHRYSLPHSRILIHQPRLMLNKVVVDTHDNLEKVAQGLTKNREKLESILAENTGQPLEKIHKDCEHDNWMSAEEALAYGLIDKIMYPKEVDE